MVRNMNHAALLAVVIAAEEIIFRRAGKVGCGVVRVFVHGDIASGLHVDAVVGRVARDGVGGARIKVMEVYISNVLREENLILLVDGHRRIFPPEERLRRFRPVAELDARFQIRRARAQHHTDHALHPVDRVVLGEPADDAAVFARLQRVIAWQEARRAVRERPVELDAARDPRAECADQTGLYHMLPVEKVVAGRLVLCRIDLAADFRHDQHVQIFVFHMDHRIGFVLPVLAVDVERRLVGIGSAGGALVVAVFREQRYFFLCRLRVGRNHERFDTDGCFIHS